MTYEENVLLLSLEMAKESSPFLYSRREDVRFVNQWSNTVGSFFIAARIAVKHMAKEYEYAYFSCYPGNEESTDYALWNQNCINEMIERGLIPSPENATGEPGNKQHASSNF